MIARWWTVDGEILAAKNIAKELEKIGVSSDFALHQGFVLVESWAYAHVENDQLITLDEAYRLEALTLYDDEYTFVGA